MNAKSIYRGAAIAAFLLVVPVLAGVTLALEEPTLPDPRILDRYMPRHYGPSMTFYWVTIPPNGYSISRQLPPVPTQPVDPGIPGGYPIQKPNAAPDPGAVKGMASGTGNVGGFFRPAGAGVSQRPDPGPALRELASVRSALGL